MVLSSLRRASPSSIPLRANPQVEVTLNTELRSAPTLPDNLAFGHKGLRLPYKTRGQRAGAILSPDVPGDRGFWYCAHFDKLAVAWPPIDCANRPMTVRPLDGESSELASAVTGSERKVPRHTQQIRGLCGIWLT